MRGWKLAFLLAVIAFLVTNTFWAYALLDQAATLKYSDATNHE